MAQEMLREDYKLTPCGHLYSAIGVSVDHKFLGEFAEAEDALKYVREHMDAENYWPNVWWITDHGNYWLIDTDGNAVLDDDDGDDDCHDYELDDDDDA